MQNPVSVLANGVEVTTAAPMPVASSGSTANDSPVTANPVVVGLRAETTTPTAVSDGDAVYGWGTTFGALYIAMVQNSGADATSNAALICPPTEGSAAPKLQTMAGFLFNGTTWDRQRGDVNGGVNQPYAMTGNRWQYAAAANGISNTTTAVTLAAAAGAGIRNYITALQLSSEALGAATELAIRDGAAGTVIWRTKIGTSGIVNGISIVFPVPLKGSANTLLEIVTLTASVTGAVYVNTQGFTGI